MSSTQLRDSKFMSAAEKESVVAQWRKFIELIANQGLPQEAPRQFTAGIYSHLITHCGHIAHYDRSGFWHAQMGSAALALQFFTGLPRDLAQLYGANQDYRDINGLMLSVLQQHADQIHRSLQLLAATQAQQQLIALAKAAGVDLASAAEWPHGVAHQGGSLNQSVMATGTPRLVKKVAVPSISMTQSSLF